MVILTSEIEIRPYAKEELALPAVRQFIESCKSQGIESCDLHIAPANNLTTFDRAVHSGVIALVRPSGVDGGRTYTVELRLYNPDGELLGRYTSRRAIAKLIDSIS